MAQVYNALFQTLEEATDERSHDAQQDGSEDADVVAARHQQPGDEADDQSDDDQNNDECQYVRLGTTICADHSRPRRSASRRKSPLGLLPAARWVPEAGLAGLGEVR